MEFAENICPTYLHIFTKGGYGNLNNYCYINVWISSTLVVKMRRMGGAYFGRALSLNDDVAGLV